MSEDYSVCKFCTDKKFVRIEVMCTKYNKPLIVGQLNSWESDYYQLTECDKKG